MCKSADTRRKLDMQGSSPESGTTNTLEIQQEQTRKYNEKLKNRYLHTYIFESRNQHWVISQFSFQYIYAVIIHVRKEMFLN